MLNSKNGRLYPGPVVLRVSPQWPLGGAMFVKKVIMSTSIEFRQDNLIRYIRISCPQVVTKMPHKISTILQCSKLQTHNTTAVPYITLPIQGSVPLSKPTLHGPYIQLLNNSMKQRLPWKDNNYLPSPKILHILWIPKVYWRIHKSKLNQAHALPLWYDIFINCNWVVTRWQ